MTGVAMLLLLQVSGGSVVAADSSPQLLAPLYDCETSPAEFTYAGFNGSQALFSEGSRLTGRDPKTGLVRWQGGGLARVRSFVDRGESLLLVGEHLELIEKGWGKRVWDFPLNCHPQECNADLVAASGDRLVVGGFGVRYSMVMILDAATGKESWPSWLTTCTYRQAAVAGETLFLLCEQPGLLVQAIDLASRRTLFSVPLPQADFKPLTVQAGGGQLMVIGEVQGERKLLLFSAVDGKAGRKFGIKAGGAEESGHLLVAAAGRFVPWHVKEGTLHAWGIDLLSGENGWHVALPGGRILGESGGLIVLSVSPEGGPRTVAALEPASGKLLYRHDLGGQLGELILAGDSLVALLPGGLFAICPVADGRPRYLGRVPPPSLAATGKAHFSVIGEKVALRLGERFMLFEGAPLTVLAQRVSELLDGGELGAAEALFETVAPFAASVPEVQAIGSQLVDERWLLAQAALRGGSGEEAAELADEALKAVALGGVAAFDRWYRPLFRLALECSLAPAGRGCGGVAIRAVQLLAESVSAEGFLAAGRVPDRARVVDLAIALAAGEADPALSIELFTIVRRLHQVVELAPFFQAHPYWALFLVEEVETTLAAAGDAAGSGDPGMSAELLHDLAGLPLADELFGSQFDPWIDAQGIYLMPADLQQERIPPLLAALTRKLQKGKGPLVAERNREVCRSSCRLAQEFCAGRCSAASGCNRAGEECVARCATGPARFAAPQFSPGPGEVGFHGCRGLE